jgi:hypothetical protein
MKQRQNQTNACALAENKNRTDVRSKSTEKPSRGRRLGSDSSKTLIARAKREVPVFGCKGEDCQQ